MLLFLISAGIWLGHKKGFSLFGPALLILLSSALLANLGLLPSAASHHIVYESIYTWVTPVSICLILLSVNLSGLRLAGKPMLFFFCLGSAGTIAGAFVAILLLSGQDAFGSQYFALGGMYTATYIGGGINFNAVAAHYNVLRDGQLFVAATVADNILSAVWVFVTLAAPSWLKRLRPDMAPPSVTDRQNSDSSMSTFTQASLTPLRITLLLGIALGVTGLSSLFATWFPAVPTVIWLTTLSLFLAQWPVIHRLEGHQTLGMTGMYLLLAVIGAHCDVATLIKEDALAWRLLAFVSIIAAVHGAIIFAVGWWWRKDWQLVSIASQANVGGTSTALALAQSFGRPDLVLPGVMAGALGNAIGTYLGIAVAEVMRHATIFM